MNQRTYLFEVVYVSYVLNVPLGSINLSASYEYCLLPGSVPYEYRTVLEVSMSNVLNRRRVLATMFYQGSIMFNLEFAILYGCRM